MQTILLIISMIVNTGTYSIPQQSIIQQTPPRLNAKQFVLPECKPVEIEFTNEADTSA
jgi:hypothetical protein